MFLYLVCIYYAVVFIVVEQKICRATVSNMENALGKIRSIADYQFGKGVGVKLFPENVDIVYSKATGRIRYLNSNGKRLATLRPTDGLLSLSITAAELMAEKAEFARCFVTVQKDVSTFIADGHDVFAARASPLPTARRSYSFAIWRHQGAGVLAVGRALLS